jgi:methoxymalonate biosynthesis acyl carrier protein
MRTEQAPTNIKTNASTSTKEDILRKYLLENINIQELPQDVDIFEKGYVNSLFAIELMTFLEKSFQIKVRMEDLDMENFKSINAIMQFLEKKKND